MYRLRELDKKDISVINQWRNKHELIDCLGATYRYINIDVDMNWYDSYMKNRNSCVRCSIVDENDVLYGLVSLTNINQVNQSAIFHIMLGNEECCGKGIGTFATKEMIKHAFNNLNLHRIELTVLDSNVRAQNLYKKCGFVKEGTKRRSVYKNGHFVDMHIYSILKEDQEGWKND